VRRDGSRAPSSAHAPYIRIAAAIHDPSGRPCWLCRGVCGCSRSPRQPAWIFVVPGHGRCDACGSSRVWVAPQAIR
jgi:hypothetical protein